VQEAPSKEEEENKGAREAPSNEEDENEGAQGAPSDDEEDDENEGAQWVPSDEEDEGAPSDDEKTKEREKRRQRRRRSARSARSRKKTRGAFDGCDCRKGEEQFPIGWLKEAAWPNMPSMIVALDTSQVAISSLKFAAVGLKRWPTKELESIALKR
jgi:hypothetical protein